MTSPKYRYVEAIKNELSRKSECAYLYVYNTTIIEERQNSEHEYWGDIQEFGWVAGEIYEILKKKLAYTLAEN